MNSPLVVSVRVTCTIDADVPKVVETLSRAAAGLGMDGLFAAVFVQREEDDPPCSCD